MTTGSGPFSDLERVGVPWAGAGLADTLDTLYSLRSSQKSVPFAIREMIVAGGDPNHALIDPYRSLLALAAETQYGLRWRKLWAILSANYNILDTDNTTDTISRTTSGSKTVEDGGTITTDKDTSNASTNQTTHTGTTTTDRDMTDGGTVTNQSSATTTNTGTQGTQGTGSQNDGIFGFNASSSVGDRDRSTSQTSTRTDNLTEQGTGSNTETRSLTSTDDATVTQNLTDATTTNGTTTDDSTVTRDLTRDETEAGTLTETRTHTGRAGVMPQELINLEREAWAWDYFTGVMDDLDKVLTTMIY